MVVFAVSALLCCRDRQPQGEAPPERSHSSSDVCARSVPPIGDAELAQTLMPRAGAFCRDPNDEPRVYGVGAPNPLDAVCVQMFNGECELYKALGLERVASVRYVEGQGGTGVVTANISRFATPDGAYAFFSHRVVGDGDPGELTTEPLSVVGQGALGAGIAYVRRGPSVVELTFTDERQAPAAMRASASAILPLFARGLAERLRGAADVPLDVALLPEAERLPLGVRLYQRDALGIPGAGRGAIGYYRRGGRGYSVFAAEQRDEGSAEDVQETLLRLPGAHKLKDMPFQAFELRHRLGAETGTWLVGRLGKRIVAVGDDPNLFRPGMNDAERTALILGQSDRLRLMRQVLAATPAAPTSTAAPSLSGP